MSVCSVDRYHFENGAFENDGVSDFLAIVFLKRSISKTAGACCAFRFIWCSNINIKHKTVISTRYGSC